MNNDLGEEIVYEDLSLEDIFGWMDNKRNANCMDLSSFDEECPPQMQ